MSRFTDTELQAKVEAPALNFRFFLDLNWAIGTQYLVNGDRNYTWNGNTYQAISNQFIGIGPIKETASFTPERLDFQLSGVDATMLAHAKDEKYKNRLVTLRVAYLDDQHQLITSTYNPLTVWEGYMDQMVISASRNGNSITLTCEDARLIMRKSNGMLYTHEHQQLYAPGDFFFSLLPLLENRKDVWGDSNYQTGNYGGGGTYSYPAGGY